MHFTYKKQHFTYYGVIILKFLINLSINMKLIILLLFCIIYQNCFAQSKTIFPEFKLTEIAQKENLSDPIILTISQDSDGLIWAGTNVGLNRLDGYAVKSFYYNPTKKDGISNNTILDFKTNFNNKFWISTGNGICYYNYTTKKIERIIGDSNKILHNVLYADLIAAKDKLLAISRLDGNWYTVDKNNKLTDMQFKLDFKKIDAQIKNREKFSGSKSNLHHWVFISNILVNINLETLLIQDAIVLHEDFKTFHLHSVLEDGNYLWISTWGRGLLRYNLTSKQMNYVSTKSKYAKQSIKFKDENAKEWIVSGNENGYTIVDPATLLAKEEDLDKEVYAVYADKENTLWLGTNKGLFFAKNKKTFISLNEVYDKYLLPAKKTGNKTPVVPVNLFSTNDFYFVPLRYRNTILQFNKQWQFLKSFDRGENLNSGQPLPYQYIRGIYEKGNVYWVISYNGLVKCTKDFKPIKWFYNTVTDYNGNQINELQYLKMLNSNVIAFNSSYSIQFFDINKEQFIKTYTRTKGLANSFPSDFIPYFDVKGDDCYFITQTSGLFQLHLPTGTVKNIPLPYNNIALSKLLIDEDNVWIASYNGLIQYNITTQKAKTYLQQDGLINDMIVGMKMSKEKILWLTTASSISCIDTKTGQIKNLFKKNGLGGGNAFGEKVMVDDEGNAIFGFENYLGFIDKKILTEADKTSKSVITGLLVNNKFVNWQITNTEKKLILNSKENSIAIHFAIENAEENNTYYYKLNNEWRRLNSGIIELAGLESGSYKITVANQAKDTEVNDFIILNIKPPFYKTLWFILLGLLTIAATLLAFFRIRTKHIRKQVLLQKTYEQKLADSEMQTLRSQMNPHFLFNTLNSINSYIIQNKTTIASEYITTFAKLMRNILELSKQEKVTIEKEISALRMYIELEALRLENKFDYSITIDKNIELQRTCIPPLIIQPFVENAIWHGLHNKQDAGYISIYVGEQNEQLIISIEDDGIGRKAAAGLKKQTVTHKSFGIDITINRIKILDPQNTVTITDLYDNNNTAMGTKVTITINTKQHD